LPDETQDSAPGPAPRIGPVELKTLSAWLDELLALPEGPARELWIAQRPPSQHALLPALHRMLAAQGAAGGPLDSPPRFMPADPAQAADGTPASPLRAGQRIGRFLLLRELGHGGMSEVWLARAADDAGAEPVALKLPAVSLGSTRFLERLQRERRILEQLDHPRIARLIDAGVGETGQQYLALAYVDGEPLLDHCNRRQLGVDARLELMLQVLQAVHYAHQRQVLHRDLKPSNILVTRAGEAWLLDFGIAKLLVDGVAQETQLTERWGRALTPAYASPEQLLGTGVTVRSDLYSLGVILYELMTGARPAPAGEHPQAPLPPSRCVRPDSEVARAEGGERALARRLGRELDTCIVQALQVDPARRQPDAMALADALRRARLHRASAPWPRRAWRSIGGLARRRRRALAWALPAWLAIGVAAPMHPLAAAIEIAWLAAPVEPRRVVLVTIGAEDHRRLFDGRSPLDAPRLKALVQRVLDGGPERLGVDIDTSAASFASLRETLGRDALLRIVWARELDDGAGVALPAMRALLGAAEPAAGVQAALAHAPTRSGEAQLRWYAQAIDTAQGAVPTLGAALAGRPGGDVRVRAIRFAATERLELPASVVLAPGFTWGDRLHGRTVLLGGRYDPADVHDTPLGPLAGVEVLAHVAETEAAGGGYLRPDIVSRLAIGLVPVLGVLWSVDRWGARRGLLAGSAFTLAVLVLCVTSGLFEAWSYGLLAWIAAPLAALGSRLGPHR
jgi:hypothetical protein